MNTTVASVRAFPAGQMLGIESDGKSIIIANVAGKYYAIGNICTHMGCKLAEGTLTGAKVQCRCHGSTFDMRTGAVVRGPAEKPEPSYKLKIDHDQILLVSV